MPRCRRKRESGVDGTTRALQLMILLPDGQYRLVYHAKHFLTQAGLYSSTQQRRWHLRLDAAQRRRRKSWYRTACWAYKKS
jgi:hypothetical protein